MQSKALWTPNAASVNDTQLYQFLSLVNTKENLQLNSYHDLYQWSIHNSNAFWELFWSFSGIVASVQPDIAVKTANYIYQTEWFPGAKLNFAENLLRFRDDRIAVQSFDETGHKSEISYKDLYTRVVTIQKLLQQLGVEKGDRIAAYMPNIPETIVSMLACTSLAAIWSSTSPDFGTKGALDRFRQIKPKILVATDGYYYKGKKISLFGKLQAILESIPSIEKVLLIPYTGQDIPQQLEENTITYDDSPSSGELFFQEMSFQDPVYIMYSSGTTGLPKCIVQGTGVLINHLKEHMLHIDLKRSDTIFYFTTCGWMMWNWLVSALAVGCTIVLYDGNPFFPTTNHLWEIAEQAEISIFGTSPKYLSALEKQQIEPKEKFSLERLRVLLSTGAPLPASSFRYVYRAIKSDLQLSSISGGTDLNGCFGIGNPSLPVYAGEIQSRALGMQVEIFSETGEPLVGEKGELVCTAPFPSMPLFFWNDPNGEKYRSAYFAKFENVWYHGDFAELTGNNGLIIYGRSDATLNPGGVRLGTAELYRVLEDFRQVEDSVVVGHEKDKDVEIVLFVKMQVGHILDDMLCQDISNAIREKASPRHVPSRIIEVPDIPYTRNLKKVELAIKNAIHGRNIPNKDALANPECLDFYEDLVL
ncbi:MAG: acetoacetate--CoA ligase [Spirochaetota bacterium]